MEQRVDAVPGPSGFVGMPTEEFAFEHFSEHAAKYIVRFAVIVDLRDQLCGLLAVHIRHEASFKQKIAETEMMALRSQMNPHFIFNSLNSIENFMMQNEKRLASSYLNKFAKLVRNILDSSKQNMISFSKDMETLKLYIELEEQRSENKFVTQLHIDGELMESDYKVPPLIIQPFVENATKKVGAVKRPPATALLN